MNNRHALVKESFVRVRAFTDAHPVTGPLGYGEARAMLDEVMERLREYGGAQVAGRELSRAEVQRQRQLVERLRDRHMRPIVTIAQSQIEPQSDVRLPVALRMPKDGFGVARVLQACEGMIEAARPFESVFVANGLSADFLAQFAAARNELEQVIGGRATLVGTHVGAREGIAVEVRRGRRAVARLDALVRANFERDTVVLAKWRSAKRIRRLPSVAGGSGPEESAPAEGSPNGAPPAQIEMAVAA